MVSLDRFSLVDASINKRSFTSKTTLQIDVSEAHLKYEEWVVTFGKRARYLMLVY